VAVHSLQTTGSVGALAEMPRIREALRWFTREKQWVNEIHLQLCRVPAPTFLEQARAEWFAAQLRSLGWHARIDRAGNVLATLLPNPQGALVALTAHLDTVLAPRVKEDISINRDGDMLGPGVSDNGAGLSALLAMAKAIKSTTPSVEIWERLLLVASADFSFSGSRRRGNGPRDRSGAWQPPF
jgi:tripeptide aminopeptidase